jgi:hypothetical protein
MSRGDKAEWVFLAFVAMVILVNVVRFLAARNVPAPW